MYPTQSALRMAIAVFRLGGARLVTGIDQLLQRIAVTGIDETRPQLIQIRLRAGGQPEQSETLGREMHAEGLWIQLPGADLRHRLSEPQALLAHCQCMLR